MHICATRSIVLGSMTALTWPVGRVYGYSYSMKIGICLISGKICQFVPWYYLTNYQHRCALIFSCRDFRSVRKVFRNSLWPQTGRLPSFLYWSKVFSWHWFNCFYPFIVTHNVLTLSRFSPAKSNIHTYTCVNENDVACSNTLRVIFIRYDCYLCLYFTLIHWGLDKMTDKFLTTFYNAFSWMKIIDEFRLRFYLRLLPSLVQIMAWRRPGDKPLSEPVTISLLTHICVTRP